MVRPDSPGGNTATLTLPELVESPRLDTSSLLDGGVLPDTINAVPLDELLSSPCVTQGTALTALGAKNLNSLIQVKRINDTVIQLVPRGPLATLQALLGSITSGSATGFLGRLQVS